MSKSRSRILRFAYLVAVGAVFAWAAWRRFSLPLAPVADPDTWGYLAPALFKLTGGEFIHVHGRNFVYPAFLFSLLRMFGDLRAIVVAQHLLGLVAGGLLLATWRSVRIFIAPSRIGDRVHEALALVLLAAFLFPGEPIRAEMELRPEGICAFLLSLNLYFVVEFIRRTFVAQEAAIAWGIGTGASAILLAFVKPSFVFLALVPFLPIAIFFVKRKPLRQKIGVALGIVVLAAIIGLPEYLLSRKDDLGRLFLPTTLFVIHADLIRDQMADDVEHHAVVPYQRDWLERMQKQIAAEIAKSAATEGWRFPSLGFSPDVLMYGTNSTAEQLASEFNDDNSEITSFYRFYYWRTWQRHPLAMLKKVGRQFALFYAPLSPVYDRRKDIPLTHVYEVGAASFEHESYRELLNAYPPAREWITRSADLAETAPPLEQSKLVRRAVVFLAGAYLPLLGVSLALAVGCLRRSFRKTVGWLVALALLVFAYNAAACLEVAIIASFDGPRYSTVQFCVTVLAEFLALRLVLEVLVQSIRWGRPIQTSAPGE